MPWPKTHKEETRARIVEAAAAEFRARGVSGVGVADIMERAGLTHGGFYSHFASKDDLLVDALERATQQTRETLGGSFETLPPEQRLAAVIDRYLSPKHAAHPERGCPVAALASELARAGRKARRELARIIRSRLDWLGGVSPPASSAGPTDDQVVGAFASMVGGIVLARGLGGAEGEAVLESCRAFLHRALGHGQALGNATRDTSPKLT
jgi:TetR/AcrR family transcriptional repressor of nem operon